MPGPISTNARFNEFGQAQILRDIEQLYLLVGERDGDIGYTGKGQSSQGVGGPVSVGGTGIPDGFGIVTISVCIGGITKSLDVIARGPY